jgi:hypothetical protein
MHYLGADTPSFAASCEGRNFGDEKGCRAARCDGVEMWNLLFQFLLDYVQESCSYHAYFLCLHGDRRGGIFGRHFSRQFNAAVINYYFTA